MDGDNSDAYSFPMDNQTLDFRPLLSAVAEDRKRGRSVPQIARAFHNGVAQGLCDAARILCETYSIDTIVLSGGVFQNDLLLARIRAILAGSPIQIWTNSAVPTNDGGISLGQAAIASMIRE